jgi:hypothetical protein
MAAVNAGRGEAGVTLAKVWIDEEDQKIARSRREEREGTERVDEQGQRVAGLRGGEQREGGRRARRNFGLICLVAAKQCYNSLSMPEEGLRLSQRALETGKSCRAHHAVAVGLLQVAGRGCCIEERRRLYSEALHHLKSALRQEPDDVRVRVHFALTLALSGLMTSAIDVLDESTVVADPLPYALGLRVMLRAALGEHEEALDESSSMRRLFHGDMWAARVHAGNENAANHRPYMLHPTPWNLEPTRGSTQLMRMPRTMAPRRRKSSIMINTLKP